MTKFCGVPREEGRGRETINMINFTFNNSTDLRDCAPCQSCVCSLSCVLRSVRSSTRLLRCHTFRAPITYVALDPFAWRGEFETAFWWWAYSSLKPVTHSRCYCCVFVTSREDPEWYLAESLTTGQQGYIPFNFVAMSTVETEPYVIQEI